MAETIIGDMQDIENKGIGFNALGLVDNDEEKYEICILCKCKTNIRRDTPIQERLGYIEGAGQLCERCYKKLYDELEK